jgi:MbtH protein
MSSIWDEEDTTIYKVVFNHEEQYSIWPAHKALPLGWQEEGKSGKKAECLDHISQVWVDMRPLSLRKAMEAESAKAAAPDPGSNSHPQ